MPHSTLMFTILALLALLAAGCGQTPPDRGWEYAGDPPPHLYDPDAQASREDVERFLDPAPDRYSWTYKRDWDGDIVAKCVVHPERSIGGFVEWAVSDRLRAHEPPRGYWWTGNLRPAPGTNTNVPEEVCVRRGECGYGKYDGLQWCISPQ